MRAVAVGRGDRVEHQQLAGDDSARAGTRRRGAGRRCCRARARHRRRPERRSRAHGAVPHSQGRRRGGTAARPSRAPRNITTTRRAEPPVWANSTLGGRRLPPMRRCTAESGAERFHGMTGVHPLSPLKFRAHQQQGQRPGRRRRPAAAPSRSRGARRRPSSTPRGPQGRDPAHSGLQPAMPTARGA